MRSLIGRERVPYATDTSQPSELDYITSVNDVNSNIVKLFNTIKALFTAQDPIL